jgi:16S rRNA (cytidine1402-2'-O)-methyltransferase
MIREHLEQQSVKDTAAAIATLTGLPKKKIYARAVELSHDEK